MAERRESISGKEKFNHLKMNSFLKKEKYFKNSVSENKNYFKNLIQK